MRHQRVINHLGRTNSHRKSMLSNMAASLILHKRISTTVAKAKALKIFIEPLITRSKEDSTHSRRIVFSYLRDKNAVSELFREISPKIVDRPGGYTRILKTGNRIGDNAEMCILELVDYNENMLGGEVTKQKTTRRRRSFKKSAAGDTVVAKTKEAVPAKEMETEEPEIIPEESNSEEETDKEENS